MVFLFIGCFRGFLAEQPKYQATEYLSDTPRIVAVRHSPSNFVSASPIMIDALLIAPQDAEIGDWTVSVCGLGRPIQTVVWTVTCFENTEEVTTLAQNSRPPFNLSLPYFPELTDCGTEFTREEEDEEDTGYYEERCNHYLPLLLETTVNGIPIYSATFNNWFPIDPEISTTSFQNRPMGFHVPQTASAGEEIALQIEIHDDLRFGIFNWYIDAGTLLDTGITSASEYVSASSAQPNGITKSNNRLLIPEDYKGTLRVWVVLQSYDSSDMAWLQATVEVQ
jgi:hypothetical protein